MSLALSRLSSLSAALEGRKLAHTLTRRGLLGELDAQVDARKLAPSGITALDTVLEGGWRRGEVSELVGSRSSGRTSVVVTSLAEATRRGELVALVDALDRFDPVSAAGGGLRLDRMLWARGATLTVEMPQARGPADQIDQAIHRAIRAIDLIVRAGGFGLAVLDLADLPARSVRALPHTTWLRLAHAVEGSNTVCLVAGDAPVGRSARGVTVNLSATRRWTGDSAQRRRFAGFDMRAQISSARVGPGGAVATWR